MSVSAAACHLVGDVQPVAERVAHRRLRLGREARPVGLRLCGWSRAALVADIGDGSDGTDVAIAPPVHRLDQALGRPVVAERPSDLLDAGGHSGLADETTAPDRCPSALPWRPTGRDADKVHEYVEGLRFEGHAPVGAAELEQRLVQLQAPVQQRGHARIVARWLHPIST